MKQKKMTEIIEGISDILGKSLDPKTLSDRRTQVIRTRDLALDAADEADKAGNSDLANQLRADADRLQQVLDNTSNFVDPSKASTANSDEDSSTDNSDNDSPDDETEDAASEDEEASEEADNADAADTDEGGPEEPSTTASESDEDEQTSNSSNSANSGQAGPTTDQETEQNEQNSENEAEEEESDDFTSSGGSSSENDEEFDDEEEDEESEQSEDSDAFDDESDDGQADDLDSEEDDEPFGTPAVKDDKILQNPFKSPHAEQQMPKDMMDKLNSGDLQIEPEIEAIIRIISKLKGEARRGAEQAIRDHYSSVDYWGNIEDEEDSI